MKLGKQSIEYKLPATDCSLILSLSPRDANLEKAQDSWEKDRLTREKRVVGKHCKIFFSHWSLYFLMATWKGQMKHCTDHWNEQDQKSTGFPCSWHETFSGHQLQHGAMDSIGPAC